MTDPIEQAKNSFIKAEPVMAAHGAAAVIGYAATELVTHGVISTTQASSLTQQVVPAATAVAIIGLGWLVRHVVSPAASFAERVEAEVKARLGGVQLTQVPVVDDGSTAATLASWNQIADEFVAPPPVQPPADPGAPEDTVPSPAAAN